MLAPCELQELAMIDWLSDAARYAGEWLDYQVRMGDQPGCVLAIAADGAVQMERAFGVADVAQGTPLTPQHRFRVASHSKTFTAVGIMKLREDGRLQLDDPIGRHVHDLSREAGAVTIAQLLSHSAGILRDGREALHWQDHAPFYDEAALRAELGEKLTIDANTRFTYSNLGFGLLGLAIEAITGEAYVPWIMRTVVAPSGLTATNADMDGGTLATGHGCRLPAGRRYAIAGRNPTNALAAATGFVSTAGDLARFIGSLDPKAKSSVLSVASRREMTRRQWRDPHATLERWYGLGTISGGSGDWQWFGHTGGFQGTITRTVCVPAHGLSLSALSNAADGASHAWIDGALHILRAYAEHGAPTPRTAAWRGRWWSLWGAIDLLPMGDKVRVANPTLANPLQDAVEIEPGRGGRNAQGRITLAGGFGSHGEPAHLQLDARGRATGVQLAGARYRSEAQIAKELAARYDA
jgi:D-alanyl-D-alanine carboxypeptidase